MTETLSGAYGVRGETFPFRAALAAKDPYKQTVALLDIVQKMVKAGADKKETAAVFKKAMQMARSLSWFNPRKYLLLLAISETARKCGLSTKELAGEIRSLYKIFGFVDLNKNLAIDQYTGTPGGASPSSSNRDVTIDTMKTEKYRQWECADLDHNGKIEEAEAKLLIFMAIDEIQDKPYLPYLFGPGKFEELKGNLESARWQNSLTETDRAVLLNLIFSGKGLDRKAKFLAYLDIAMATGKLNRSDRTGAIRELMDALGKARIIHDPNSKTFMLVKVTSVMVKAGVDKAVLRGIFSEIHEVIEAGIKDPSQRAFKLLELGRVMVRAGMSEEEVRPIREESERSMSNSIQGDIIQGWISVYK